MISLYGPLAIGINDTVGTEWFDPGSSPDPTSYGLYMRQRLTGSDMWIEMYWALAGDPNVIGFGFINPNFVGPVSPLVIDMDRNGIKLGGPDNPVEFDLLANGGGTPFSWVAPDGDDAFLVVDHNDNGLVDDGSELFGEGMPIFFLENNRTANGFTALDQFDVFPELGGNFDGVVDSSDAVWNRMYLWLDSNANGVSEPEEMTKVGKSPLVSVDRDTKSNKSRRDRYGNLIPEWSFASLELPVGNGEKVRIKKAKVYDVFFQRIETE